MEIQCTISALHTCEPELCLKEVPYAAETEAWLRSKHTNNRLYVWLKGRMRALHFDLNSLAAEMSWRAEKSFVFECGARNPVPFLWAGWYWGSSHDGLLATQQFSLYLRKARFWALQAYDYELSQSISLWTLGPQALWPFMERVPYHPRCLRCSPISAFRTITCAGSPPQLSLFHASSALITRLQQHFIPFSTDIACTPLQ